MKKSFLTSVLLQIFLASSFYIHAQITIGSGIEPNKGSLLDLKEHQPTNAITDPATAERGLGMPRVSLTSLTELKPMYSYTGGANTPSQTDKENHVGLIVYNINEDFCAATPIVKGIYVWNGAGWDILGSALSAEVQIFKDQEGKNFKARTFGSAGTWMIENLAVKKYADNTPIELYDGSTTSPAVKSMYAYPANVAAGWSSQPAGWSQSQGLLYSWRAATNNYNPGGIDQSQVAGSVPGANEVEVNLENPVGAKNGKVQGVCPAGWHLPSDREWNVLEKELYNNPTTYSNYTSTQISTFNPLTWQDTFATSTGMRPASTTTIGHGGVMKSICQSVNSNNNPEGHSLPAVQGGFDAMLVGNVSATAQNYGVTAFFWTSSARAAATSFQRNVTYNRAYVARSVGSSFILFSVRCKKD
ncbi:FISUMP domain-containing protein [Dysgonomonas sp. ZJ279]|uniref:FISUMP domain-containing protein n=1 Tax=Dysgonomonas sp. ZJ279 TaxID=2709796 RepID=UPI0013EB921B|nr:FISUMP domain-containing protein [Dysgonomonas sp. ZJ279]